MTERLPPELLLKNLHPDFRARHLKERREKKATLYEFVEGARTGDIDRFAEALRKLGDFFDRALWRKAMRGVARIRCPDGFREWFLRGPYLRDGDCFRQEVGSDLLFMSALRSLLPARTAGPVLSSIAAKLPSTVVDERMVQHGPRVRMLRDHSLPASCKHFRAEAFC